MDDYVSKYSGEEADALLDRISHSTPYIYDISLSDGISNIEGSKSTYCKTQEGIVVVSISVYGNITHYMTLGSIPTEYSPSQNTYVVGYLDSGSTSTRNPIILTIDKNGTIRTVFLSNTNPGNNLHGTLIFLSNT